MLEQQLKENPAEEIFMPEGQCARCSAVPAVNITEDFDYHGLFTTLAFCSENCRDVFCAGNLALQRAI